MAPSAVSAWVAPEATQRAALPIGHTWDTRDERAVKGEVPERQGEAVRSRPRKEEVSGADQGGEELTNSRSFWREEPDWNHEPSQSQSRTEIASPRKQTPKTRHASGESWPRQDWFKCCHCANLRPPSTLLFFSIPGRLPGYVLLRHWLLSDPEVLKLQTKDRLKDQQQATVIRLNSLKIRVTGGDVSKSCITPSVFEKKGGLCRPWFIRYSC
ncbi:hypothetical protein NDU88_001981 [Pleurodeles waltl]|uniref:Uncharacterized protein n=1 Tax=Pleurodeles waltl TaxID=8319 RepID=A0AAV7NF04_PLEWA|nr:hypothetical protein NDU88_001981 [Pleurodeles waltl]